MIRTTAALIAVLLLGTALVPSHASASTYKPSSVGVRLEVTMGEDGSARVSGARVREVTDNGFVAETLWGTGKISWTVITTESTPILRKSGAKIALTDVTPGDYVSFAGKIQANMPPFTVEASSVRDWSVSDNHIVLSGTVEDIDRAARTISIRTGKGTLVTVKTDEDTAYAQSGARTFSDLSVGDTILAFGDKSGATTIAATKVNLTERAIADTGNRREIATGLGSWLDQSLSKFFFARI